ncbi:PspC domain-containing protein [Exiguobacterium sp. SH3S2]|uniref:PspC domain-containing protein n=1 Tax=Exiguobacterium TaxID=33986 RepID=UPI0003A0D993|nr:MULTISPECIES: PspC domain-containing protein [Exiguobacterium]TCI25354.1 PspC domain-containing protein [Exiguobacterium sp. SH5S4]TCI42126.1 PspC domain-containing protein [Exiguobacterium sp. SH5S32]TCI42862.1 PspC domain-containing protein [Exiguobacterium sp. SH3S3]TCI49463.1 PspC domain-containing protein [Exiguobacterium sp. SH1S4]TCI49664.1 PspC domain-containing protein [Exiguobacterium sp. SH5S13]
MQRALRKSATDRSLAGVCGGIAEYFGMSSLGVRLLFLIMPGNILVYIILANSMQDAPRYL